MGSKSEYSSFISGINNTFNDKELYCLSEIEKNLPQAKMPLNFKGVSVGLCIKNSENRVIFQNNCCQKICGASIDSSCRKGCLNQYSEEEKQIMLFRGFQKHNSIEINGIIVDTTVVNDGEHVITILHPKVDILEKQIQMLKEYNLSKREVEISILILKGLSRKEVRSILEISHDTLKTHLNNIYKKLPLQLSNTIKERKHFKQNSI